MVTTGGEGGRAEVGRGSRTRPLAGWGLQPLAYSESTDRWLPWWPWVRVKVTSPVQTPGEILHQDKGAGRISGASPRQATTGHILLESAPKFRIYP